jgi:hypothetical protein
MQGRRESGARLRAKRVELALPTTSRPMNTTANSTKEQIITAAVELTDWQASQIEQLRERQAVLIALIGVLSLLLLV